MEQIEEREEDSLLTQGIILDGAPWGEDAPLGIVLTNPCDLENDKASFLLLAACLPASEVFCQSKEVLEFTKEGQTLTSKQRASIEKKAEDLILNKTIGRYFSIDASPLFEDEMWLVVDFQNLLCVEYTTGTIPGTIVGQLVSPYCQQMLHSYASYTARVGVDRPVPPKLRGGVASILAPLA